MEPAMNTDSTSPSHRRVIGRVAVLAFVTVLVTAGCSSSGKSSYNSGNSGGPSSTSAARQITVNGQSVVVRGEKAVSGAVDIRVDDNAFTPNVLTAPAGSTVTLNLTNAGGSLHNISEPGESIDHDLPKGASFAATLHVRASGQLVFFCKYHRDESGMVGVINVS